MTAESEHEGDLSVIEGYLDVIDAHGVDSAEAAAYCERHQGDAEFASYLADVAEVKERWKAGAKRREFRASLSALLVLAMLAFLLHCARWSGYQTAVVERDQRWQQQLIEKNLGRWVIDPATGERRFEVGAEGKGSE